MEEKILRLLRRAEYTPLNAHELRSALRLPPREERELQRALHKLERTGQIARIKQGNRYALPLEADLVAGRIRMNRQGVGFLQPDDPKIAPMRIPADATSVAMHGDHVLARRDVVARRFRGHDSGESTGRVVRVLQRARSSIVGTLRHGRHFLYVIPDDPRIPQDVYVPPPRDVGRPAREGDKVVVELRQWENRHTNPEGEIIEVLGAPDEEGVDMLSILRQYHLPLHFPKRVLHEARAFGSTIKETDLAGRVDCREHLVITIDPEDAKDFDDAFSLVKQANGWKLWVHIADVSHYVKPGSALDAEAAARGNSTYLVDRVIPMLPEALSNELCSLKPGVERLTRCVEFNLANDGRVLKSAFYGAVIRSRRRFNYKEVFGLLQQEPGDEIQVMLRDASRLAQQIRRARFGAGALDLDFPESKIFLDERGEISRIEKVENDLSHQLIEEFMLLANEAVAARLMSLGRPAIYRIHEPPADKRLQEYREQVLSHHIPCGTLSDRREIQKLLEKLNHVAIGSALKIGFLKSLMRARYAVEPLGHYGLAKKKYTHFTSPIRRYADLVVHRALFSGKGQGPAGRALAQISEHISETERNSDDAERDSRDIKLFAFLLRQLRSGHPHAYPALITDVRNFGFFVDVPALGLSGLVPLSGLSDDFYQFDPDRSQLTGRRTRRVFKLGDRLSVEAAKVDTFKRQVDFRLARHRLDRAPAETPGAVESRRTGRRVVTKRRQGRWGDLPGRS